MINMDDYDYSAKDSEKFKIMTRVFRDIFVNADEFANKIGVGRSTVYNWLQKENASFNTKSKMKVAQAFGLLDTVWSERFDFGRDFEKDFEKRLCEFKKIEKPTAAVNETCIMIGLEQVKIKDKQVNVKDLSPSEIDLLLAGGLKQESAVLMYEIAQKLKSDDRIDDALQVLEWIDAKDSGFKYIHENALRLFKAVLLSHDAIRDWDGAIHILRSLYHSAEYHLKNYEVLTLMASNYKRKALEGDLIDRRFLTSAMCLYQDAYNLKPDNEKYYDAVNLAYLHNITDAIDVGSFDKTDIETLYKTLSRNWRVDRENWWEVISEAEILMLLGKVDLAILKVNAFFDNHRDKMGAFDITTTLRQLNLYIDITDDNHAKQFANYLEESWENLR